MLRSIRCILLAFQRQAFKSPGGRRSMATFPSSAVEVGDDNGLTYQRDISIANLNELTDIFYADTTMGQAHVFSENNLRAMTVSSEFPWSTARNLDGQLVACAIGTRVGHSYWRSTGLFVLPEYRRKDVGPKTFRYCNVESLHRYPLTNIQYVVRDGVNIGHITWPDDIVDERMSVRVGKADNYKPGNLPESGNGFTLVPFKRGELFDKLVYWDTARVHWIPRPVFLHALLTPGVVNCYVALDDKTLDVVGYGAIQFAFNKSSHIIGPLYADNDDIALVLLRKLMEHYIPGNNLGMMHFNRNQTISQVMDEMGVRVMMGADSKYVGKPHPERFKDQVYLISNCGTQFY